MAKKPTHTLRIRVRAGDTDYTGLAFNARIVEWFSAGRIELLRSRRITYLNDARLAAEGKPQKVSFVVGEIYARFLAPVRFDELVELKVSIAEVRDKTVKFNYVVKSIPDKRLLATGNSTSVCVDLGTMRSTTLPSKIATLLNA